MKRCGAAEAVALQHQLNPSTAVRLHAAEGSHWSASAALALYCEGLQPRVSQRRMCKQHYQQSVNLFVTSAAAEWVINLLACAPCAC